MTGRARSTIHRQALSANRRGNDHHCPIRLTQYLFGDTAEKRVMQLAFTMAAKNDHIDIQPVDGAWKVTNLQILQEERL